MEEDVYRVVVESTPSNWQEVTYWWSQVALAFIALGTAIFAIVQLLMLRATRLENSKIARGTLLLGLDERWESDDMTKAREAFHKLRDDIAKEIETNHQHLNGARKRETRRELYCKALSKMRTSDFVSYEKFMRIWGFLETLGYLYRHNYLSLQEIDGLLGHSISQIEEMSRMHLEEREEDAAKEKGTPVGLYEHALKLASDIGNPPPQSIGRPWHMVILLWVGQKTRALIPY